MVLSQNESAGTASGETETIPAFAGSMKHLLPYGNQSEGARQKIEAPSLGGRIDTIAEHKALPALTKFFSNLTSRLMTPESLIIYKAGSISRIEIFPGNKDKKWRIQSVTGDPYVRAFAYEATHEFLEKNHEWISKTLARETEPIVIEVGMKISTGALQDEIIRDESIIGRKLSLTFHMHLISKIWKILGPLGGVKPGISLSGAASLLKNQLIDEKPTPENTIELRSLQLSEAFDKDGAY